MTSQWTVCEAEVTLNEEIKTVSNLSNVQAIIW